MNGLKANQIPVFNIAVKLFLEAMGRHPSSAQLLHDCTGAIAQMSKVPNITSNIISIGGIELLLMAMENNLDEGLQGHGADALYSIVHIGKGNIGSRGIELVRNALKKYPKSKILHVAWYGILAELEGIEFVLKDMEKKRASALAQESGTQAVMNFVEGNRTNARTNALKVISSGGIMILIRAMQQDREDPSLRCGQCLYQDAFTEKVCKAFGFLVAFGGSLAGDDMRSHGIVELLHDVVLKYPKQEGIQLECKYALQLQ